MDLRDEVAGTHGTIWLNHFLRTGFEMFTAGGGAATWRRRPRRPPAGCSPWATRCPSWATSTCSPTCSTRSTAGGTPRETFYDGYVVNAIMDACYRSAKSRAWEPVELFEWRGGETPRIAKSPETYDGQVVIKREILPDGREKLILKDPATRRLHRPDRRRRLTARGAQPGGGNDCLKVNASGVGPCASSRCRRPSASTVRGSSRRAATRSPYWAPSRRSNHS